MCQKEMGLLFVLVPSHQPANQSAILSVMEREREGGGRVLCRDYQILDCDKNNVKSQRRLQCLLLVIYCLVLSWQKKRMMHRFPSKCYDLYTFDENML